MKSSATAMRQVRQYLLSSLLFLLIFFLNVSAQPNFRAYTYWTHPVIKKLEKHDPTVIAFIEKSDDLVILCIADTTENLAYFVTQFGTIFDTLHLTPDRKKELQTAPKNANPFHWFESSLSLYDPLLEDAKNYLRENGNNIRQASLAQQAVLEIPTVKKASSTLAKVLAIEEYQREVKGILLHFNWWINSARDPGVLNSLSEGKKPGSLIVHGTLKAGYSEFINKDQLSRVRAARLEHSTGVIHMYGWSNNAVDSFSIKKDKIGVLLNEKTDVFVLYRAWLEYKLQFVNTSIPSWKYAANYELLKNKGFIHAGFAFEKSAKSGLVRLQQEKRELLRKIDDLVGPDAGLFSTIIANSLYESYRKERRKWDLEGGKWMTHLIFTRGQKRFELTDHRGNVMATVSDRKTGIDLNNDGTVDHYEADITTATAYYPFGMLQPGRKFNAGSLYRYGFNGKENDNDVKGEGNQQDYGMRIYDPRMGRFLSVDPLKQEYPQLTPYQFSSNRPIDGIDRDGAEFVQIGVYLLLKNETVQKILYKQSVIERYKQTFTPAEKKGVEMGKGLARGAEIGLDVTEKGMQYLSLGTSKLATSPLVKEAKKSVQEIENIDAPNQKLNTGIGSKNPENNTLSQTSQNRGLATVKEDVTKRNKTAQEYEDATTGATSDVLTKKRNVPALKYDNPNPKGKNIVKFDGYDVENGELIDRKLDVTTFEKSINQIKRMSEALKQNPEYKGVIEVPDQRAYNNGVRALMRADVKNITIRIKP